jgi:hypothetical protein
MSKQVTYLLVLNSVKTVCIIIIIIIIIMNMYVVKNED